MKQYTLRKCDRGQEVARMQGLLSISDDGIFGPQTEASLKTYQLTHSLVVDGIAGTYTLDALGMPVWLGIDVSSHNGTIDWSAVAASGVKFAWIKVTEGTTHTNPGYEGKFRGARDAGLVVGGYHFSRPDTNINMQDDVYNEAQNYLNAMAHVGIKCGDLVPALDLEAGVKTDDAYNAEWALKWLSFVQCAVRARPIVYTAKWAWNLYLRKADSQDLKTLCDYPVWWASYKNGASRVEPSTATIGWDSWDVWQWSGSSKVPGVRGKCDTNWMNSAAIEILRAGEAHDG